MAFSKGTIERAWAQKDGSLQTVAINSSKEKAKKTSSSTTVSFNGQTISPLDKDRKSPVMQPI